MLLFNYLEKIGLPNAKLLPNKKVCAFFCEKNIFTLWTAIENIWLLPYGRTTDRENYLQIFDEEKGACSGKHALIAHLAEEISVPLKLILGIFLLNVKNTPQLASILEENHLDAIPEAHCYLQYNNYRLDITFPEVFEFSLKSKAESELILTPQQIGAFKIEQHQSFIRKWLEDKPNLQFENIWAAREKWIGSLSHI